MKKILMSMALLTAAVSFAFAGELGDIYFNKEFNPIGVHRWFEETPTPADMVKSILRGPNGDEMEDGIFSAVPANWVLDSVTENGAFIDINMKPVPKGTLYETGEIEDIWVQFDKTLRYRFGLTPRLFIDGNPIDDYEVPVPDFSCDKPFIHKNERMRTAASGPLSGKLIAVLDTGITADHEAASSSPSEAATAGVISLPRTDGPRSAAKTAPSTSVLRTSTPRNLPLSLLHTWSRKAPALSTAVNRTTTEATASIPASLGGR